jgi:hypothetical protein
MPCGVPHFFLQKMRHWYRGDPDPKKAGLFIDGLEFRVEHPGYIPRNGCAHLDEVSKLWLWSPAETAQEMAGVLIR